MEKRITENTQGTSSLGPEKIKQTRTTQLCICNKKGNEGKEDTKQKQEELNKLINELKKKNLIEILKMIKRQSRNIFQQFQMNVRLPKSGENPLRKEKIQTNQKKPTNKGTNPIIKQIQPNGHRRSR